MSSQVEINSIEDLRLQTSILLDSLNTEEFQQKIRDALVKFEYQGLNVNALSKRIFELGQAGGRTNRQVLEDIAMMISLFLARGNNIKKMLKKSNDEGKVKITELQTRYALADRVGGGGNEVLTLSRVAAVMPVVTLRLLILPRTIIPRAAVLPVTDFGTDFPKSMQTVIAAAVFPRGAIGRDLMKTLLLYLIAENRVLGKPSGETDRNILDRVVAYARASYVSSIVVEENKIVICQNVNFLTPEGTMSNNLVTARDTFNRKYPDFELGFTA